MPYAYLGSFDDGNSASGTTLTVSATYTKDDHVFIKTVRSGAGTETITDGTNTYTLVTGSSITGPGGEVENVYECLSTAAGTFTVQQTLGTARLFRGMQGLRYSGLNGSSTAIGQSQLAPGTGADAVTSTNLTPGSQPGILVGFAYDTTGGTVNAGTGFTSRATFPTESAANGSFSRGEDKRLTSTAAVAATFTLVSGGDNVIPTAIWCAEALLMGQACL